MTSSDRELELVRAENAALNEQLKLLVRTEQRLHRAQNAREHELRRIRELGAFALDVVNAPRPAVLRRAIQLVRDAFTLDEVALVELGADGSVIVTTEDAHRHVPLSALALSAATPPRAVIENVDDDPSPELAALLDELAIARRGLCARIPLDARATIVAVSAKRSRAPHRLDRLDESHQPLLQLVSTHVQRVLESVALNDDLRQRTQSLTEANARLAESLRTIETTHEQLVQAGKMEAIGRLAGGVAHDFNNLLTVIMNHAELASMSLPPDSVVSDDLANVLEASKRAAELTSQLLALGRKTVQRRANVDVGAIALDLGRVLRALLTTSIELLVDIEPGCFVFADRTQIEQVILNLVVNARDAMPRGGTVRLNVRACRPADRVSELPAAAACQMVVIEVADTGIGMDASTRARIFEPFFTTKVRGDGVGLGLAVVYGAVTQSDGFITVNSEPDAGTRFVVMIPRSTLASETPQAPPTHHVAAGARILLVEDNDAIRAVATRVLERAGYSVVHAIDGVEALAIFERVDHAFDLVLTDLNMPRMSGFELAARLGERSAVRVLFMTGFSNELAEASRRSPLTACMTKPFTPAQLLENVGEQLRGAAQR